MFQWAHAAQGVKAEKKLSSWYEPGDDFYIFGLVGVWS